MSGDFVDIIRNMWYNKDDVLFLKEENEDVSLYSFQGSV